MAGENIDFKVRVLGVKQLVELNKQIQATSKELSEKKKALKTDEKGQQENMNSVLQLTDTLKKQRQEFREGTKQQQKVQTETKKTTSFTMKMATAFGVAQIAVNGLQKVMAFLGNQIKDGITVFKDFDFQMQKVKAISGATDAEFERLSKTAQALGRTTFFTATQVAELQTNLSKLGFTADEVLKAQDAALATATATGENLARTATVMGSAIRGFGLDASEATRVADVMASAFTSSALDIEKFQTAMTKVAPIAKMAGFEIEGTTAILASLTDAGIEASIAGTSLRNIFLRLADPTSLLSKRLGGSVSSVDELIPKLKEMKDAGINLSDVLEITDKRTAAAFGRMLDSADSVELLTEQLRNSEGAAEAMSEIVGESLQGAMLRFKSATDGLKIALVDLFGDNLQKLVDKFAKVFNNLASEKNIKRFAKFAKTVSTLVKAILLYTIGVKASSLATLALSKILRFIFIPAATGGSKAVALMSVSLKGLKAAIASTGIGLLVVGLGQLAINLMKGKSAIYDVVDAQDELNKSQKRGREDMENAVQQTTALANSKRKLNELLDKEGNLLNKTAQGQAIYNEKRKRYRLELANINKINKSYNQTLLSEKATLEDIITSTDSLMSKMKDRMLQDSFQTMSKQYLDQAVNANLLLDEFTEGVTPLEMQNNRLLTSFEDVTDEVANARRAIEFLQDNTNFDTDVSQINQGDFQKLRAARLRDMLESEGMTLDDFAAAIEAGFYEEKTNKISESLQKQMSGGTSIFGAVLKDDKDDPDSLSIGAKREAAIKLHNENRLLLNQKYKNDVDKLKRITILEEIRHLEVLRDLNNQAGLDLSADNLKIAKKEIELDRLRKQDDLNLLTQEKINRKNQVDEDHANNLITDLEHKQAMLGLEAWFIGEKANLLAKESQDYLDNQNKKRESDINIIKLEKEAMQERIAAVDELGSVMSSLGNVMGENHILTKIGTKLSQAAAVAKNIETLRTLLQTKADEAATTTSLIKMTAEGGEGVTTQSKLPFPANIAAMAATLAVVVSVLSMFGGSGQSSESVSNTETMAAGGGGGGVKFANGGLTNGGMFKGASHANGGVKFASGGRIHEAEGGEAIINKRSTNMFKPVLSAINSYNGNGVKFADGGLLNSGEKFARGGQLSDVQSLISSSMPSQQQVVIVESEVTRTQGRVSAIESQATF
jgi:TP901 family phage tail tape measure protein